MGFCHVLCIALFALCWIGGRTQYIACNGITSLIADGYCDSINNNIMCGYDGGDCCECTCSRGGLFPCGFNGFDCLNTYISNATSKCQNTVSNSIVCSTEDTVHDWVVNDTASARAFAKVVNCTGGTFNVTWMGRVIIDRTIYVAGGTTVHLTGADSGSEVNGGGSIRIFILNHASLHIFGMSLSNGYATYGGAIAAFGSNISLDGTEFYSNVASSAAGAIYMVNSTCIGWGKQVTFAGNTGDLRGGALVAESKSHMSWNGPALFVNNTAYYFGGAVYIHDSSVSWSAETSFVNNSGGYGGSLYIGDNSGIYWSGETSFTSNSGYFGGAVYIHDYSDLSWSAETSFTNNHAKASGGALYAIDWCNIWWYGETSFRNNIADRNGGALLIFNNCNTSWTANSWFNNNIAESSGGAIYVQVNSDVSWSAETIYTNNSGYSAGAMYVGTASSASWTAETSYVGNNAEAGNGGALYADDRCNVWWDGKTSFSNNVADWGGALFIYNNSNMSWTASSWFNNNIADSSGGAIYVQVNSEVSWSAETIFANNIGGFGGAMYVLSGSSASWTAQTSYIGNNAVNGSGGALYIQDRCIVWWGGVTSFVYNAAHWTGGAILLYGKSNISWTAASSFNTNIANFSGGAIYVNYASNISWEAPTTFFNNSVLSYFGGAIYLHLNSGLFWGASTSFVSNNAGSGGGALGSSSGSNIDIGGKAVFFDNVAGDYGGAVYVYHGNGGGQTLIVIHNTTVFRQNTCEAYGGGMALVGSVSTDLATASISFSGNIAGIAGGAVYGFGVEVGPRFVGTSFAANSAEMGGGVYLMGSGIALDTNNKGIPEPRDPVSFHSCEFIENKALTRGGALDSGAGTDLIRNTSFVGNRAESGGALRLAGVASLDGCSFIENISDEDKGPAIYNEGFISYISNSRFNDNDFSCEENFFLAYDKFDVLLDTVCKDCDAENGTLDFKGKEPICVDELDHSSSPGGNITVELLSIKRGYWRASNTSTKILACYNANACQGGKTGSSNYCLDGYEGPYCSVCSDGYTPSLGSSCNDCSDRRDRGIALVAVVGVVAFVATVAFVAYMLSGREQRADRGFVARISRFIPFHSLKIVIVVWQILTQFTTVANISFSNIYQRFLDGVDALNFDFSWIISTGCIIDIDFHDRLLISTLGPVICMGILGTTYTVAINKHRGLEGACHVVWRKHVSMVLLLTFLVYSSVSTTLFEMFVCDDLDDGTRYLRADYRIDCESSDHKILQIYACFMIVLYAIGIPAFYASLLFSNRVTLTTDKDRDKNSDVASFADLWKPYEPRCFYYEVIECCRRVLLSGIVVFIYPDSAAQIAVAILMAIGFFILFEVLTPYVSPWDCLVSRMGHVIIFTSLFLALLLKVDVSGEGAKSQKVFEAVLVAVHVVMIVVVTIESGAIIVVWKNERVTADPDPRHIPRVGVDSLSNVIEFNVVEDEAPYFGEGKND